jgi:hypothetical protein
MRHAITLTAKLLAIAIVGSVYPQTVRSAELGNRWEYRVLTKAQVLELGRNDLTAGLNKLGDEGWELAGFDAAYIFKRPKVQQQSVEVLKLRIGLVEADVEQQRDRVRWSQRMVKRGFLAVNQLKDEERLLKELEIALEEAKQDLKSFQAEPKKEAEKIGKPKQQVRPLVRP